MNTQRCIIGPGLAWQSDSPSSEKRGVSLCPAWWQECAQRAEGHPLPMSVPTQPLLRGAEWPPDS